MKEYFQAYASMKQVTLSMNRVNGHCHGFGLLEFFGSEDAEYLHRVITAADFRFNGHSMSAVLSKLNKDSFYAQYKIAEQSEPQVSMEISTVKLENPSAQEIDKTISAPVAHFIEQPVDTPATTGIQTEMTPEQVQEYYKQYYETLFAQLAQMGLYYDPASNSYKPLSEQADNPTLASTDQVIPVEGIDQPRTEVINIGRANYKQNTGLTVYMDDKLEVSPEEPPEIKYESQMEPPQVIADEELVPLPVPEPLVISTCYLCNRGFYSLEVYNLHMKLDALHKELTRKQLLVKLGLV